MLVDLIDDWFLLLGNLDCYPLGDDDGDTSPNNVVSRFLLSSLGDQRLLDERVKVDLIV